MKAAGPTNPPIARRRVAASPAGDAPKAERNHPGTVTLSPSSMVGGEACGSVTRSACHATLVVMARDDGDDNEAERALEQVRTICLGLPEVSERLSHGAPSFFIRGKKSLAMFHDDHHGDGELGIWCPAPPGVQSQVVETEPERFYVPAYVGHRGWLGMRLDRDPDWGEVAEVIREAYRTVAPKKLIALLDE